MHVEKNLGDDLVLGAYVDALAERLVAPFFHDDGLVDEAAETLKERTLLRFVRA